MVSDSCSTHELDELYELRRILLDPGYLAEAMEPVLDELLRERIARAAGEAVAALAPTLRATIREALQDEMREPDDNLVSGLARALEPSIAETGRREIAAHTQELIAPIPPAEPALMAIPSQDATAVDTLEPSEPVFPLDEAHEPPKLAVEEKPEPPARYIATKGCRRLLIAGSALFLAICLSLILWHGYGGALLAAFASSPEPQRPPALSSGYHIDPVPPEIELGPAALRPLEGNDEGHSIVPPIEAPSESAPPDQAPPDAERSPDLSHSVIGSPDAGPMDAPIAEPMPVGEESTATEAQVLYLTFDDGPHATWTTQILEVLARYGARATFFVIGKEAARQPDLVSAIVDAGHTIGHHTWSHRTLAGIERDEFYDEIEQTSLTLGDAVSPCLRPPAGIVDENTRLFAQEMGLEIHRWRIDPVDWTQPGAEEIASIVIDQARPGRIVLLHDGGGNRSQTVAALEMMLEELSARGYVFEPLCRD
ncbi:MAG TPA: polysaccharide deacetylase family protein [Chloroflexi bacterium]|nr:polysaccharide deacetylase family protein [Chloroflexota bacterium]